MRRAVVILFVILFGFGVAVSETFVVDTADSESYVKFKSSAKLEFIEGSTSNIFGSISFDPGNPLDSVYAVLQVDLRTLKTGIELRDEHMRDRHLHTDDYPFAYFVLSSITGLPQKLIFDSTYQINGKGYFYIHGVKRKLEPKIIFAYNSSDQSLNIKANFELSLDDYKIDRPKALFLKLAEKIEVNVIFNSSIGSLEEDIQLPDWLEIN